MTMVTSLVSRPSPQDHLPIPVINYVIQAPPRGRSKWRLVGALIIADPSGDDPSSSAIQLNGRENAIIHFENFWVIESLMESVK